MVESPTLVENLKRLESFRETIKTEEGTLEPLPEIVLDRARRLINNIPDDKMGVDIGEETIELFAKAIMTAKTVVETANTTVLVKICINCGSVNIDL